MLRLVFRRRCLSLIYTVNPSGSPNNFESGRRRSCFVGTRWNQIEKERKLAEKLHGLWSFRSSLCYSQRIQITLNIPDELARQVAPEGRDPARVALEALAFEGYRTELLSESAVRQMLGFQTRMEGSKVSDIP